MNNPLNLNPTLAALLIAALLLAGLPMSAQTNRLPAAPLINDEGGVQSVTGQYFPSAPSLRDYGSQPVIFLGDISNVFVDGGFEFSLENLNLASPQIMGYTEGDIRREALRYNIQLPINPGGTLTDLDRNNQNDPGVAVYTVNFTFNGIGSPFIDAREFIAFSSITYSRDYETLFEINGGKMLLYTITADQAFPTGYGADGLLFTADDPLVALPLGYTVVDLDAAPFTFDRSQTVTMNIRESEGAEFTDYSNLSYTAAFDAMVDMLRREYAFTDFKQIDWDILWVTYRPLIEAAEAANDSGAFSRALDKFLKEIPDGHIGSNALQNYAMDYFASDGTGIGIALVELEDGQIVAARVRADSPAGRAGIRGGALIRAINGQPMQAVLENQTLWFGPYSTDHNRRLAQLEMATRFGAGSSVTVTFQNPNEAEQTVSLIVDSDPSNILPSPFEVERTGFELPVEFDILPSGYGYIALYSFSDDNLVSLLLWERAMRQFIARGVSGIVIDMRSNNGGSPDISNVMLGYLFSQPTYIGTSAYYFPDLDTFAFDPLYDNVIEPAADLYFGDVVVIVAPTCFSACEFFSYALSLRPDTEIVGFYPTGGLGGGIKQFAMPANIRAQFTVGRAVGADNTIHIEGTGVVPTRIVPRTAENLFSKDDPLLAEAVAILDSQR